MPVALWVVCETCVLEYALNVNMPVALWVGNMPVALWVVCETCFVLQCRVSIRSSSYESRPTVRPSSALRTSSTARWTTSSHAYSGHAMASGSGPDATCPATLATRSSALRSSVGDVRSITTRICHWTTWPVSHTKLSRGSVLASRMTGQILQPALVITQCSGSTTSNCVITEVCYIQCAAVACCQQELAINEYVTSCNSGTTISFSVNMFKNRIDKYS